VQADREQAVLEEVAAAMAAAVVVMVVVAVESEWGASSPYRCWKGAPPVQSTRDEQPTEAQRPRRNSFLAESLLT